MGDKSAIEWTDATWNPTVGCSVVSPGCTNCYAMKLAPRLEAMGQARYAGTTRRVNGLPVWTGQVNCIEEAVELPLRWKRPRRVFVNSMSDLFHEAIPFSFIDRVFAVMALAPQHVFQVLTKRPGRMLEYAGSHLRRETVIDTACQVISDLLDAAPMGTRIEMPLSAALPWPLPNVWLGISAEDQRRADERIPLLLQCPAAVRFVSAEPLLGPVDLAKHLVGNEENGIALGRPVGTCIAYTPPLDWVITGGESGPGARPMHPEWARSLRDQCQAAGAAFFFKQHGQWAPICDLPDYDALYEPAPSRDPEAARRCKVRTEVLHLDGRFENAFPRGAMTMFSVGKKRAGRLLDSRTWDEMPEERTGPEALRVAGGGRAGA